MQKLFIGVIILLVFSASVQDTAKLSLILKSYQHQKLSLKKANKDIQKRFRFILIIL